MTTIKRSFVIFAVTLSLSMLAATQVAMSQEISNYELMKEVTRLKVKTDQLEAQIKGEMPGESGAGEKEHYHSVKSLADRVRRIEGQVKEGVLGNWADRIELSGLIEIEVGYEDLDFDDSAQSDKESSDIVLATVELGVDVDIAKHVKGHVLFLWEEDDTEPVDVDEGIITIDGEDVAPVYLNAGKMYVPFGNFESHFISDPLTLELGETRESALNLGFANEMFDVCVGAFNGDIDETGEDNHVETYFVGATFTLPEGTASDLGLTAGASYISNIADSDSLQDEDGVGQKDESGAKIQEIKDYVGGASLFVSLSLMDQFFLEAEYLGATESFEAGELGFDEGESCRPSAWNIELAYAAAENLEFGVKYEGSDDCGDFLPESQYGAIVSYSLFENTSLALEYLYGEFENDDERNLITCQLGIEF